MSTYYAKRSISRGHKPFHSFTIEGALLNPFGEHPDYPVFFYRGDILMAVRFGAYKMHVVTWATPKKYAQPASCFNKLGTYDCVKLP